MGDEQDQMVYVAVKTPSLYSGYDSSNFGGSSVIMTKVFHGFPQFVGGNEGRLLRFSLDCFLTAH
jgi:hypothetical protein